MYLVLLEHVLMVARMVLQYAMSDLPKEIEQGNRDRRELIDQYVRKNDHEDDFHADQDIIKTFESINDSKETI